MGNNEKRFVPQQEEEKGFECWWYIRDTTLNCCIQFENGDIFGCKTKEEAQKLCDFLNSMWIW